MALTARGRRFAALLACGDGAVLSHQTAADVWNIRPTSSPRIHVSLSRRTGRRRPGLVIHRPRRLPQHEVTTRDGLAVTSVARTLLDLADVVPLDHLRRAVERAEKLELFDQRALRRVLAEHPGRRTRTLERALSDADFGRAASTLESDFLALCKAHGLPRPEVNVMVAGHEVDFFFPAAKLVVETDGWLHHRTKERFEADRRRDVAFAKAGLRHVRFTHDRIAHESAEVAGDVGSLLGL